MKQVEEINLLDEWIFPETEDPLVGLSVKIIDFDQEKIVIKTDKESEVIEDVRAALGISDKTFEFIE